MAETETVDSDKESLETAKSSCSSEPEFAHIQTTNQPSFTRVNTGSPAGHGSQESVAKSAERQTSHQKNERGGGNKQVDTPQAEIILSTGLQHITLKQVLVAASDRYRSYLPMESRPMNWNDVIEVAYRLRPQLHISQRSWVEACDLLGRSGAAVCLLLTDRAALREDSPVAKPAAYFYAMLNKGRAGELRLHNSIFGLTANERNSGE